MRVGLAASVGVSSSAHVSFIHWVPGDLQDWRKLVAVVIRMSVRSGRTWGWVGLERRSGMGTLSGGRGVFWDRIVWRDPAVLVIGVGVPRLGIIRARASVGDAVGRRVT